MPLSKAEISRRYRKNRKKDLYFVVSERERKRKLYVPIKDLSQSAQKKRQQAVNERVKDYYERKKQLSSTGKISLRSNKKESLKVCLPFTKKGHKKGVKQRQTLKKAYSKIEKLTLEKEALTRKSESLRKKVLRLSAEKASTMKETQTPVNDKELTPKSKTDQEMKDLGLSPNRHAKVRRRLLAANVIENDLKEQIGQTKKKQGDVSFPSAKRYRCAHVVSTKLGIDGRTHNRQEPKKYRELKRKKLQQKVIKFLEGEDNSSIMPGKKDTVGKEQKMVFDDYLHNLYEQENYIMLFVTCYKGRLIEV